MISKHNCNYNEKYNKLANDVKTVQLDYYFEGNYCDVFNKSFNHWLVAEIIERDDDEVKTRYESMPMSNVETHLVSKETNLALFRKFTCCKTAAFEKKWIEGTLSIELLQETKTFLSIFISAQCNVDEFESPLEIAQILRGKIYFMLENAFITPLSSPESDVEYIVELLRDYIAFSFEYFQFVKEHIGISELLDRNYYFFLYDKECAMVSAIVEVVDTLKKVFGDIDRCRLFYEKYSEQIRVLLAAKYGYNNSGIGSIGKYFKDLFVNGKGMETIIEILSLKFSSSCNESSNTSNEITIPFFIMNNIMALLNDIKEYLSIEQLNVIQNAISNKMLNVTEYELKAKDIQEIDILCYQTSTLFLDQIDIASYDSFGQLMKLLYVLKLLTCKILQQKIKGISILNKHCEELITSNSNNNTNSNNNNTNSNNNNNNNNHQFKPLITKDILLSWLKENKIIEEIILGVNIHEEIIKRSNKIFIFIIQNNAFSSECLDLLWKCLNKSHESISNEIKTLLVQLSIHFTEEIKAELFAKLSSSSYIWYSKEFIIFLRQLTINSIVSSSSNSESNVSQEYGLEILWKIMHTADNSNIIEMSIESIKDIFKQCQLNKEIIHKYLTACIESFHNESSVVQSMKLFKTIVEIYGSEIVDQLTLLDKKYNIIELIIKDVEDYMMNNAKKDQSSINSNTRGVYSHAINLETRLTLIFFMYEFISNDREGNMTKINIEYIISLWNIFMLKPTNVIDKNIFCHFIYKRLDSIIINRLGDCLFNQILLDPKLNPPSQVIYNSMNLFIQFFYKKNEEKPNNRIEFVGKRLRIKSIDIFGFDFLWDIMFDTSNEKVKKATASLLVEICLNPIEVKEDLCLELWDKYTSKLVNGLKKAIEENSDYTLCNIIYLIKQFILGLSPDNQDITKEDLIKKNRDNNSNSNNNTIQISFYYSTKGIKRFIPIAQDELVYQVKDKVSCYFKLPYNLFTFNYDSIVISYTDESKLFSSLLPFNNEVIQITDIVNPILTLTNNPKTMIVENTTIFNSLFTLLNHQDHPYIKEINEIIYLLPQSHDLITQIDNCLIEDLFKSVNSSIYSLSYIIDIIKTKSEIDSQWTEKFFARGGTKDVLAIFIQFPLKQISLNCNLSYKCIEDLIAIINNINEIYTQKQNDGFSNHSLPLFFELEVFQLQKKAMISKILAIMVKVFHSSLENDSDPALIQLQNDYNKKKRQELNANNLYAGNNNQQQQQQEYIDEDDICGEIRELWDKEYSILYSLFSLLDKSQAITIEDLKDNNDFITLISDCLIYPKNKRIKLCLFEWLPNNLKSIKPDEEFYILLMNIMFNLEIFTKAIESPDNAEPFFQILEIVISKAMVNNDFVLKYKDQLRFDIEQMVKYMLKFISDLYDNQSTTSNSTSLHGDNKEIVLNGFLSIIKEIASVNLSIYTHLKTSQIFELLYFKCLFSNSLTSNNHLLSSTSTSTITSTSASASTSMHICKYNQSRYSAFKLLSLLTMDNETYLNDIINKVSKLLSLGYWRTKNNSDWNIIPSDDQSPTGYIGLLNLGCTCYMNSLLQQLFSIQSIREHLLQSTDFEMYPLHTSVLFHLKIIFASLLFSNSKFHNPKHFTNIFTNYEGRPLNTFEQMDVDEFLNLLLDRLEVYFMNEKNPIKAEFQGTIANELICQGCPHSSASYEVFNSINLQVKNKQTLINSLDTFFGVEMLEGDNAYYCSECKIKIPTLKTQCIKELPSTLVIVLKRFVFDYDKLIKIKVNDYCEFPYELDMHPYTKVSKSNSPIDTLYQLRGFIVHKGTAESGHYFSVIYDKAKKCWMEFNDVKVAPYDQRDIAIDGYGFVNSNGELNNTNAYVLFYERKNVLNDSHMSLISSLNSIQDNISLIIKDENQKNCINKILFSNEFSEFVQDITINYSNKSKEKFKYPLITKNDNIDVFPLHRDINCIKSSNLHESLYLSSLNITNEDYASKYEAMVFPFYCHYFFFVGIRMKDRAMIPRLIDIMKALLNANVHYCKWLISQFSNIEVINEFLVDGCVPDIKIFIVGILYCAMIKITKANSKDSLLFNFINCCMFVISKKHFDYKQRNLSHLYQVIFRFTQTGNEAIEYLNAMNMLDIIELFYSLKYKLKDEPTLISMAQNLNIKYEEVIKPQNELASPGIVKNEANFSDQIFEKNIAFSSNYECTSGLVLVTYQLILNDDERKRIIFKNSLLSRFLLLNSNDRICMINLNKIITGMIRSNNNHPLLANIISDMLHVMDITEETEISSLIYSFDLLLANSGDILPNAFKDYLDLVSRNTQYYLVTLAHIKNIVYLWYRYKDRLNPSKEIARKYIDMLIEWINNNPYAPQFFPSKNCTLYKKSNVDYSKINVNPLQYRVFLENYKQMTNTLKDMLNNILNDQEVRISSELCYFYNEEDYSNFKFSSRDKIYSKGIECIVVYVLDEMVYVDFNSVNKSDSPKWIMTETSITIKELNKSSSN